MMKKLWMLFVFCLAVLGTATQAQAKIARRFTLILDFKTCATDPANSNIIICQEKDGTGKPVGQIKVTFLNPIGDDGTCSSNPGCAMSWHEGYLYTLDGGTITVDTATAWQEQARITAEAGFAPVIGFSVGSITSSTGRYAGINGTLSMRWDDTICICLFEIVER